MNQNKSSDTIKEKIIGIFSFVSGVTGIITFMLDYPEWALLLVSLFIIGTFLYFGDEIKALSAKSKSTRKPKFQFWLTAISTNQIARLFAVVAVIISIQIIMIVAREITFLSKQGWVETIDYQYRNGMEPVHLASLPQSERVAEIMKVINPVIYHNDRYLKTDDQIRFEGHDYTPGDFDTSYFSVYVAGYDPTNSILESTGNPINNFGDEGFANFVFGDHFTYFIHFNNPHTRQHEYVRLHFFDNSGQLIQGTDEIYMKVYVSYLAAGNRFDGLLSR